MKRSVPFFLACAAVLAGCSDLTTSLGDTATPLFSAGAGNAEYVPGQIIVRFTPGANRSEIAEANRAKHKERMLLERTEILEVPVGEEIQIASRLSRNPNVEFAEPDYITKIGPCEVSTACTLPDGQFSHYKWDLHNTGTIVDQALGWGTVTSGTADADIDWAEAYDHLGAGFSGSAVIAILDTGIRTTHTAFAGKILAGRRFVTGTVTNYTDDHGHGSHVAGIAASLGTAAVPGVAYSPNIKLLVGKVCDAAGNCPNSATANAIVWAADNGANVINMSLGAFGGNPDGSGAAVQQTALQYANSKNVLSVCATGNDDNKPGNGYTGGIAYPARFPECMAVGATSWTDTKASYSNFGAQIEVSAPGGDDNALGHAFSLILAPGHTSNTGYAWKAGTSMATPQVAGLAALLFATGVTSANQVRERIKATAQDLGTPGWDPIFGAGRINVYRALTGLEPNAPPVAVAGAARTGFKGQAVEFDASASYDPNGKAVTYAWSFGDGGTGTGVRPTHTYLRAGMYTVTLTATDASGRTATATTTATIQNRLPAVSAFAGATILAGETYTSAGSFTDADADEWSASVNYGDGSGAQPLPLAGQTFALGHTYTHAGVFTVSVTVSDDDGGVGAATAQVTVLSAQQAVRALAGRVSGVALTAPLAAAADALDRGQNTAAVQQVEAFVNQVAAMVRAGRMPSAEATALVSEARRIIRSIGAE